MEPTIFLAMALTTSSTPWVVGPTCCVGRATTGASAAANTAPKEATLHLMGGEEVPHIDNICFRARLFHHDFGNIKYDRPDGLRALQGSTDVHRSRALRRCGSRPPRRRSSTWPRDRASCSTPARFATTPSGG